MLIWRGPRSLKIHRFVLHLIESAVTEADVVFEEVAYDFMDQLSLKIKKYLLHSKRVLTQ